MKFAIIAAGEGARLAQEGLALPKPLVKLNGMAMVDRLISIFTHNDAEQILIIINTLHPETRQHLLQLQASCPTPITLVEKTTPSSMHSFWELSPYLAQDKFVLTTVDTIFREDEFTAFVREFRATPFDGLMGVTSFVDDESPLYVSTDESLNITGFHDEKNPSARYVSGGIYALTPPSISTLRRCMDAGMSRMRNFQRQLIADHLKLKAYPFTKILDVDHAQDVAKAETFLLQN